MLEVFSIIGTVASLVGLALTYYALRLQIAGGKREVLESLESLRREFARRIDSISADEIERSLARSIMLLQELEDACKAAELSKAKDRIDQLLPLLTGAIESNLLPYQDAEGLGHSLNDIRVLSEALFRHRESKGVFQFTLYRYRRLMTVRENCIRVEAKLRSARREEMKHVD